MSLWRHPERLAGQRPDRFRTSLSFQPGAAGVRFFSSAIWFDVDTEPGGAYVQRLQSSARHGAAQPKAGSKPRGPGAQAVLNRLPSGVGEFDEMAICEICGKRPRVGMNVSHAHNRTKRFYKPNLQKVRVKVSGSVRRAYVCAACLRAGKVAKA